jgi:hypothetical protein
MKLNNLGKKGVAMSMIALSMIVGAIGGSTVLNAAQANAQATTTTPVATTPAEKNVDPGSSAKNTTPSGTFKSNEDPTHEAKESADWEAQENAGKMPWKNK